MPEEANVKIDGIDESVFLFSVTFGNLVRYKRAIRDYSCRVKDVSDGGYVINGSNNYGMQDIGMSLIQIFKYHKLFHYRGNANRAPCIKGWSCSWLTVQYQHGRLLGGKIESQLEYDSIFLYVLGEIM